MLTSHIFTARPIIECIFQAHYLNMEDSDSEEAVVGSGGFGGLLQSFQRDNARKEEIKRLKAKIKVLEEERRTLIASRHELEKRISDLK
jgi:hypothetical protein